MDAGGPLAGERYHLFGIAGRGMASLAVAARHLGAEVTGCDRAGNPEIHRFLERVEMPYERAHSIDHVVPGTTVVATSVASASVPEIAAADDAGARWHRTDLLATVLRCRVGAGITGTHGKGTVTALTGAALASAGLDPLVVVGAHVPAFDGMVRLGAGPVVAEVDDSDLSLARVATDVGVVTNLDHDHLHLETTLRQSVEAVGEFVSRVTGRVVLGSSPRTDELAAYATAEVWRHGRDFSARTLEVAAGTTRLELRGPGDVRVPALMRLIGPRTGENAAIAFATALALGAEPEAAAEGLSHITALARRLELVGTRDGIHVFDDYGGKHPVPVRLGVAALRRHFPASRITAVFEAYGPYLSAWGRRYAHALSKADHVVVVPPFYAADYPEGPPITAGWDDTCTVPLLRVADRDAAVDAAIGLSRPGDVVVFFAQTHKASVMARTMATTAASDGGVP